MKSRFVKKTAFCGTQNPMGNICSSKKSGVAPPPLELTVRTSDEVRDILTQQLRCNHLHIGDSAYGSYSIEELRAFLASDNVNKLKYHKNRFDCDNFALVLAGREAEYFANASGEVGSTFGIVHGDIRKDEKSDKTRPHAVNVFIDDHGKVWLIEPQTDEIYAPTKNSTFWFVLL